MLVKAVLRLVKAAGIAWRGEGLPQAVELVETALRALCLRLIDSAAPKGRGCGGMNLHCLDPRSTSPCPRGVPQATY